MVPLSNSTESPADSTMPAICRKVEVSEWRASTRGLPKIATFLKAWAMDKM
jgi:hypothetical protein